MASIRGEDPPPPGAPLLASSGEPRARPGCPDASRPPVGAGGLASRRAGAAQPIGTSSTAVAAGWPLRCVGTSGRAVNSALAGAWPAPDDGRPAPISAPLGACAPLVVPAR